MARIVCPYCFEPFAFRQTPFRCLGADEAKCPQTEDEPLKVYRRLGMAPRLKPVFVPPPGRLQFMRDFFGPRLHASCPRCRALSSRRLCPHCHNELPSGYGQQKSRIVAMIGAKESGKSHYIAVLIHALKKGTMARQFGTMLVALDEHTISREKEYERYLFGQGQTIPATLSGRSDSTVRSPMVFRLNRKRRWPRWLQPFSKWLGYWGRSLSMTLVFFDTAGEDLDHIDHTSTEAKYIARSDGLIFLLDPLQVRGIRDRVASALPDLPAANTDPSHIVDRVMRLFHETPQSRMRLSRITSRVALTFSKVDAVRSIFPANSPVHQASHHAGFYDRADGQRVHESIQGAIHEHLGPDLPNKLLDNFTDFTFCAVSSLGAPPVNGRLVHGVAPFRVEDPFLYILSRLGFIPSGEESAPKV